LFALDTGSTNLSGCDPDLAALWVVDLTSNEVRRHSFDRTILFRTSYLNDLAVDAHHGVAYLVDSGGEAPNALLVLDLETGTTRRVLDDHPTVRAGPPASPEAFRVGDTSLVSPDFRIGATAAARSPDGATVYWTKPDTLCSIPSGALRDESLRPGDLDRFIHSWPRRDFAADGIDQDHQGRLVMTDVTNNAVTRFDPASGEYERIASDPRIDWPDGIAFAIDGSCYVTASQMHRSGMFDGGADRRHPPFAVLRIAASVADS
jgi:sugar lactone lactonase YvrE